MGKVKRGVSGTRVRYWADRQIFPSPNDYDGAALASRLRQTSFLVPGLSLRLIDERSVVVDNETDAADARKPAGPQTYLPWGAPQTR